MAGNPFSPALVHRKALHLMEHSALPNAALKAEAVFQKTLAKHPINDQTFPERPLTEHELPHTQHLHGGLQDQRTGNDDFGPTIVDGSQLPSLRRGHRDQMINHVVQALPGDAVAMQFAGGALLFTRRKGANRHRRAAGGYQNRGFTGFDPAAHFVDRRFKRPLNEGLQE